MFSKRVESVQPSGIRKIYNLAQSLKNPIDLSIGTTDFDVPEEIKTEAIQGIQDGLNQYTGTQGLPELRAAIAEHLHQQRIIFDDVLICNGVTGGMLLTFLLLLDPGDEILIPDPHFVLYPNAVRLAGGIPRYFSTYPDFHLHEEEIRRQITPRTRAILICSPNNPTGVVYSIEELKMVARIAEEHNLYVLSDEIYEHFLYDNLSFRSVAEFYPRTIVFRGFSKSWAMSGWRVAYVAASREVITHLIKFQQSSFICVAPFVQKAALAAMKFDGSALIKEYERKRNLVYEGLKDYFEIEKPQGAFFMFPKVPFGTAQEFVERAIQKELLIVPGNAFSALDSHFRLSFAVSNEKLERGIEILQSLVR